MKFQDLKADSRTATGNGPARQLRMKGLVPAVLYGRGKDSEALSITARDLEKVLKDSKAAQVMLNLSIEGGAVRPVMIKELQVDTLSHRVLHVDFYEVDMGRKLRVKVPVHLQGKSIGVENGGMLQVERRDIDVLCLPDAMPNAITLDVTSLNIGEAIHVKDIPLEGGLELPADINYTIVTCLGKQSDAGADAGAAEAKKA